VTVNVQVNAGIMTGKPAYAYTVANSATSRQHWPNGSYDRAYNHAHLQIPWHQERPLGTFERSNKGNRRTGVSRSPIGAHERRSCSEISHRRSFPPHRQSFP